MNTAAPSDSSCAKFSPKFPAVQITYTRFFASVSDRSSHFKIRLEFTVSAIKSPMNVSSIRGNTASKIAVKSIKTALASIMETVIRIYVKIRVKSMKRRVYFKALLTKE